MQSYTQSINGYPLTMRHIQGGTFDMGDEYGDLDADSLPIIKDVAVSDFHLAEVPVTHGLWKAVMGAYNSESRFSGNDRPVERVSWDDICQEKGFLDRLNALDPRADGLQYRRPTEAHWEFAARGGIYNNPYQYAGSNRLKEVGWYDENSHRETKPVKLKLPNALGLYDMSGNVWEWCADHWHENHKNRPLNGDNPWNTGGDKKRRVLRGGSWDFNNSGSRVAYRLRINRDNRDLNIGFRLARY